MTVKPARRSDQLREQIEKHRAHDQRTRAVANATLSVHFACNDPDSGHFAGQVEMVEFCEGLDGELLVSISGNDLPIEFDDGFVDVGGIPFRKSGRDYHVGNWCWDAVTMSLTAARALLGELLTRGWQVEEWCTNGPLADIANAAAKGGRIG